ncbi:MAG: hypothetical protein J7I99_01770 [Methanophagales archaeon]|nr:hypothetical protein [Methanophagales archaeon]
MKPYEGKTFKNYLGNYWSDYKGSDTNEDGIGDTPYSIDSDKDKYPLMEHWENYFALPPSVFDTGPSENPYPSIFGTHNGTITPHKTLHLPLCGHRRAYRICPHLEQNMERNLGRLRRRLA